MVSRIFISYRRSDAAGHARLLNDYLGPHYPGEVFFDNNTLEDGDRFDREIANHLGECEVLLAVIGPGWLKARDEESGMRRIDMPEDWVRREIESGLLRAIRVIPILMGGTPLPKPEHLPSAIRDLAKYEARNIGDRDARDDVRRLAEHIGSAPVQVNAAAYLRALRNECAYIEIRGLQVSQQKAHRFRIDELYTPLTTVLAPERKKDSPEKQEPVPLQQALRSPKVILVGDPGAGKSTFLRRIVFAVCETLLGSNPAAADEMLGTGERPFPLLIPAASLSNYIDTAPNDHRRAWPPDAHSPEWLLRYLEWKSNESGWGLPGSFFFGKLCEGCLLLVDGLDEAPDRQHRDNLAKLLERAGGVYSRCRIVAATRPSAYGGATSIDGFDTVTIDRLDDEAIATFVANWCRALFPDDPARAETHRQGLTDAIRSKPEIAEMAVNPVMLTALAVLHWNDKRLPDQRIELYESVLKWLARAKEEKPGRLPADRCLDLLQHLAFTMHGGEKGKQVEIAAGMAARALAPRFRDLPEDERAAKAEEFLRDEEMNSGILVGRGSKLRYWHLTFQEYLAAKALSWRDEDRRRLLFTEGKLYLAEWRETVLLLAGVLCQQAPELADGFLKQILDTAGTTLADQARCVGLIGRVLQDLKAWNYRIADERYTALLARMPEIFEAKAVRKIDFRIRLEAAEALGQAGDPRLERNNWVRVDGGAFWMGAQTEDPKKPNYDPEAYSDESPVRREEVKPFFMGRYPVTVQEYSKFVDAGGYGIEAFWSAGGYGQFDAPGSWPQQQRYPNRPVVEVSWWEASAYCAWAGVRLPTEAEWECSARCGREGVKYPWGKEEPDEYRANFGAVESKGPRQSTPVGMYPEGATPSDILDLAGNVYEWTSDSYDKEREVIRGGSWVRDARYLRVSDRYRDVPQDTGRCHRVSLCPGIAFPLVFFSFSLSIWPRVCEGSGAGATPRREIFCLNLPLNYPSSSRKRTSFLFGSSAKSRDSRGPTGSVSVTGSSRAHGFGPAFSGCRLLTRQGPNPDRGERAAEPHEISAPAG